MSDAATAWLRIRKKSRREPEYLFKDILRIDLEPWQLEIAECVQDIWRLQHGIPTRYNHEGKKRLSIRSGHGPGKTYVIAAIMHMWGFTRNTLGVCTAPKLDQLTKRLWPRYRLILRSAIPEYQELIDVQSTTINIAKNKDNGFVAETATDPDNLAGYHDSPQLVLIDEAGAKALDPMFPVIEGALSTKGSCCIEIGNPTRTEGEFFAHHNKPSLAKLYYRRHVKPEESKYVDADWMEVMKIKYGIASPIYQVRVLGNFATMSSDIIFHYNWLAELYPSTREIDGSIPELIVSTDVADGGADLSVITVAYKYLSFMRLVKQETFSFPPDVAPALTAREAIRIYDEHAEILSEDYSDDFESRIVVDTIGVGAGAAGEIRLTREDINVISHKGSHAADDRYRNARCFCYFALANDLEHGRIVVDDGFMESNEDWDEFCADLMAVTRVESDKLDDIITKKDYKKKCGKSPDRPDSVSMLYNGGQLDVENLSSENEIFEFSAIGGY